MSIYGVVDEYSNILPLLTMEAGSGSQHSGIRTGEPNSEAFSAVVQAMDKVYYSTAFYLKPR